MAELPRYYWDSCVFLSFIEGTLERAPTIEALIEECEEEKVQIWTSHITIAEVAFAKAEKDGQALAPEVESEIDTLWHPDSPFRLVEVTQPICIRARSLMRHAMPKGWSLRVADAVHLATALAVDAGELHTYDSKLLKYKDVLGITVREPWVFQPSLLPGTGLAGGAPMRFVEPAEPTRTVLESSGPTTHEGPAAGGAAK